MSRLAASAALILGMAAASVLAQSSGGDYELTQSTIDTGGGASTGADYELIGTVGQPEANARAAVGGGFVLAGGFWAHTGDRIFSDGFE